MNITQRPVVEAMEHWMYEASYILDHGFVRLMDYMGDEKAIEQAARVSYMRGTRATSETRGLIRYLMRHHHTTPFEMCEIKLHVKLPIFVARQWIRHRTANVNEMSARFSILDREFYIPKIEDMQAQSTTNSQGRGVDLDPEQAEVFRSYLVQDAAQTYEHYEEMVGAGIHEGDDKPNLARELARMNLPTNIYTQWYWKVDLHNLLHFLRLRADPHAQWEIRQYADVICRMVSDWVPNVWEAFQDYHIQAHTFSRQEMMVIRSMIEHAPIMESMGKLADMGLSERERQAFMSAILKHGDKA